MEFPKPVMKKAELMEMGFPEEFLNYAFRHEKQDFASKMNPTKENSPLIFDTEKFGKFWERQIKTQRGYR